MDDAKADWNAVVRLDSDHPGFLDAEYRARRNRIARLASEYRPGAAIPDAPYTPEEHEVWRIVREALEQAHRRHACAEYLECVRRLDLPRERIPQLREVSEKVQSVSGFRLEPVAGLVEPRVFLESLAGGVFLSTQYIRHHSVPLYTPEPDVIHEIVGHGNMLGNRRFADVYELAGHASKRAESDEAMDFFSRVFWFTLEFGVVHEPDGLKAYGAGILSSPGEIEEFRGMTIRPLDLREMGTTDYDITRYQEILYAAESFGQIEDVVGSFWDTCDDDSIGRLLAA